VLSISVPPSLWDEIGEVAEKEKMTRSELLRVAVRDYIRSQRWAELREKGARTAAKYGVKSESDVDRILEVLVPAGERSRTVNDALAKELLSIRRRKLTERLRTLRKKGPAVPTEDIVAALRKDRENR